MTRRSIVLALVLVLLTTAGAGASGLAPATPEQVGLSSERLQRIGNTLQADVERGRIAGAVVLVARRGRLEGPRVRWIGSPSESQSQACRIAPERGFVRWRGGTILIRPGRETA